MDDLLQRVRRCEALQQPEWGDPSRLRDVQAYLRGSPALIRAGDILALRATLARVARGEALVVQCGDCAEDMDDHHAENVARKAAVLELLAGALRLAGRRPVIRVGRIAGQYAKPRSKPHEQVGEQTLPVYRGDMVNGREAHAEQRRADPQRILKGYAAARNIMRHLGWDAASGQEANASPVWTSHEMLLLDYELSMLREDEQRRVSSVRPTGRGSASAPARSTAPMWRCWPRCSTRWPARSVRRSAATSCWRSASASTRAASRDA